MGVVLVVNQISQCGNSQCQLKGTCYRYTDDVNQNNKFYPEEKNGATSCRYFWSNSPYRYNYISKKEITPTNKNMNQLQRDNAPTNSEGDEGDVIIIKPI